MLNFTKIRMPTDIKYAFLRDHDFEVPAKS